MTYDGMWEVVNISTTITLKNIYNQNEFVITLQEYEELKTGKTTVSKIIHERLTRKSGGNDKTIVY